MLILKRFVEIGFYVWHRPLWVIVLLMHIDKQESYWDIRCFRKKILGHSICERCGLVSFNVLDLVNCVLFFLLLLKCHFKMEAVKQSSVIFRFCVCLNLQFLNGLFLSTKNAASFWLRASYWACFANALVCVLDLCVQPTALHMAPIVMLCFWHFAKTFGSTRDLSKKTQLFWIYIHYVPLLMLILKFLSHFNHHINWVFIDVPS